MMIQKLRRHVLLEPALDASTMERVAALCGTHGPAVDVLLAETNRALERHPLSSQLEN